MLHLKIKAKYLRVFVFNPTSADQIHSQCRSDLYTRRRIGDARRRLVLSRRLSVPVTRVKGNVARFVIQPMSI